MQVVDVNGGAMSAAEAPARAALPLSAFLSGRAEEEIVDLLAFALYCRERGARDGEPRAGEEDPVIRCRRLATAELTTHAYRLFHNQIEEIRLAAVREHLGALPRPPGFLRLTLASMLGVGLAGSAALWAMGQGGLLAEMAARAAAAIRGLAI